MSVLPIRAIVTPLAPPNSGVALEFHGWNGWIGELEEVLDKYHRPGASGHGSQSVGKAFEKVCTAWRAEINETTAEAFIKRLQAAKGPAVSIKDPYNRIMKRCRLWTIDFEPIKARGGQVSGTANATMLIRVSMLVERLPDG
jgi:hypothetical protein